MSEGVMYGLQCSWDLKMCPHCYVEVVYHIFFAA